MNEIKKHINDHVKVIRSIAGSGIKSIYDYAVYNNLVVDDLWYFQGFFDKNAKILDFGCGRGTLTYVLGNLGYKTVGVDLELPEADETRSSYVLSSEKQRMLWRETESKNKNVKFEFTKNEKIPFKDNFFDVVISYAVLEHVEQPDLALAEIYRVLKPGGYFFISRTPNIYSYTERVASVFGIPAHDKLFREKELVSLLESVGLTVLSTEYIDFFPSCVPLLNQLYQFSHIFLFQLELIIRRITRWLPGKYLAHHFRIVCKK